MELIVCRGPDTCHRSPFAQRPGCCFPRFPPLQRSCHHPSCMASCLRPILPRSTSTRRRRVPVCVGSKRHCCAIREETVHEAYCLSIMAKRVYSAYQTSSILGSRQTCSSIIDAFTSQPESTCSSDPDVRRSNVYDSQSPPRHLWIRLE